MRWYHTRKGGGAHDYHKAACGTQGRNLVRAAGIEPAQAFRPYGFSHPLRLSPPRRALSRQNEFGVWTIPSPWHRREAACFRCCPSSLYTFPRALRPLGLARDCHLRGSPDFEQFYVSDFPERTQIAFKSVASTSFATPAPPPHNAASAIAQAEGLGFDS
jgi:hypothetical protein